MHHLFHTEKPRRNRGNISGSPVLMLGIIGWEGISRCQDSRSIAYQNDIPALVEDILHFTGIGSCKRGAFVYNEHLRLTDISGNGRGNLDIETCVQKRLLDFTSSWTACGEKSNRWGYYWYICPRIIPIITVSGDFAMKFPFESIVAKSPWAYQFTPASSIGLLFWS